MRDPDAGTVARTKPLQQFIRGRMMADATDECGIDLRFRTDTQCWIVGRAGVSGSRPPHVAASAPPFHAPEHGVRPRADGASRHARPEDRRRRRRPSCAHHPRAAGDARRSTRRGPTYADFPDLRRLHGVRHSVPRSGGDPCARLEAEATTERIITAAYAVLDDRELADFGEQVETTRDTSEM